MSGKYREFLYTPCPHTCTNSSTINFLHQGGTLVIIHKSTLIYYHHPSFRVYMMVVKINKGKPNLKWNQEALKGELSCVTSCYHLQPPNRKRYLNHLQQGEEERWRGAWQPAPVFLLGESPWTEEPVGLLSMGLHRVGHNQSELACAQAHTPRNGASSVVQH